MRKKPSSSSSARATSARLNRRCAFISGVELAIASKTFLASLFCPALRNATAIVNCNSGRSGGLTWSTRARYSSAASLKRLPFASRSARVRRRFSEGAGNGLDAASFLSSSSAWLASALSGIVKYKLRKMFAAFSCSPDAA